MCALELLAVAMLLRRAPLVVGLALIPLSVPIAVAMEVANADCVVLIGMLAWRLPAESRWPWLRCWAASR